MARSQLAPTRKKTAVDPVQRRVRRIAQSGKLVTAGAALLRLVVPVLLGCGACYYIVTADFLAIRTIRTSGCDTVDCEKIAARAGIVPGRNIFFADVGRTMRLLERDPLIRRAVVKRILPDIIEIQVEEHRPVAVLELDTPCLVDGYGDVYFCTGQHDPGLPVITGLSRAFVLANGERAAVLLDSALALIRGLQKRALIEPGGAVKIHVDASVGLTLDDDGTQIFVGLDKYDGKLKLLELVRGDLAQKGLTAGSMHIGSVRQAAVSLNGAGPPRAATRRRQQG